MKLQNNIIVSDFDGTIFRVSKGYDKKSVDKLHKYSALGGLFTIATGRALPSIMLYHKDLPINAPVICGNGAVIYDINNEKVVYSKHFEVSINEFITRTISLFPQLSCEVFNTYDINCVNFNDYTIKHLDREGIKYNKISINEITNNAYKILFIGEIEDIDVLEEYYKNNPLDKTYCVRTQPDFLEIMPVGVSKAIAIEIVRNNLDIPKENVYTIGDYDNDIEMIDAYPNGSCVGSAKDNVKKYAKIITSDFGNGGVGDLTDIIINKYK